MIYSDPKFFIGGDCFITIELGDEGSLQMNLHVLTLEKIIWDSKMVGLIDTTALRTTIMIHYDPFMIQADKIIAHVRELTSEGVSVPEKIPSNIIHLPVYYDDPATRDCAAEYGVEPNIEIIARDNQTTPEAVIEIHSQPNYFVSYTSFMYGSFGSFPINPKTNLITSKYKIPRKWTPSGTLGMGGNTTAFYSVPSPGGIMMLGNIPVRTFDLEARNPFFKDDPLLIHPGEQLRFMPIQEDEYDYLKNHQDDYQYQTEECFIDAANL
ncbi:allophanate hydrolase subunit 1 [Thermodesulfobacteriota bacterium]